LPASSLLPDYLYCGVIKLSDLLSIWMMR